MPSITQPLLFAFAAPFTQLTFQRWLLLGVAAILTPGRRTGTTLLRTVQILANGHPSCYQRLFSQRCWTLWGVSQALASFILTHWVPKGSVSLMGDDTFAGNIRVARSLAKRGTATLCAPRTHVPPGVEGTSGSFLPSWCSFPLLTGLGPCRYSWPCISLRRRMLATVDVTRLPPPGSVTKLILTVCYLQSRTFQYMV